jgi:hypothetical protein
MESKRHVLPIKGEPRRTSLSTDKYDPDQITPAIDLAGFKRS